MGWLHLLMNLGFAGGGVVITIDPGDIYGTLDYSPIVYGVVTSEPTVYGTLDHIANIPLVIERDT